MKRLQLNVRKCIQSRLYHCLLLGIMSLGVEQVQAARLALVIGNAAYQELPLKNPVNDAKGMAAVLEQLGFTVILRTNAGLKSMDNAVQTFQNRLSDGDVGLFYFSGHGIQHETLNYLLPTNNQGVFSEEWHIQYQSLGVDYVLESMLEKNRKGINIIILEACRNTPSRRVKGTSKGLAQMNTPIGTLIAYAAAPGQVASDNLTEVNAIYTKHLLAALRQMPQVSITNLLEQVTKQVSQETSDAQVPWYASLGVGTFCISLNGCSDTVPIQHFAEQPAEERSTATSLVSQEMSNAQVPWYASSGAGTFCISPNGCSDDVSIQPPAKPPAEAPFTITSPPVFPEQPKPVTLVGIPPCSDTLKPGTVCRDRLAGGSLGPEMVVIPGGIFQMGSEEKFDGEKPVHLVTVTSFAMGKYEVTVAEFHQFVQATDYKTEAEKAGGCLIWTGPWKQQADNSNWNNPGFQQTDKSPVVCVSWNDATQYTQWLSQKTGKFYRLPTEAEWEYAARAGTQTDYYWGNQDNQVCQYANVRDRTAKGQFGWTGTVACADGYAFTAPVGSYKPNAFGLYDMAGNVWEWTCSAGADKYEGNELTCATGGEGRVLRGGSWPYYSNYCRSAYRGMNFLGDWSSNLGFRTVVLFP